MTDSEKNAISLQCPVILTEAESKKLRRLELVGRIGVQASFPLALVFGGATVLSAAAHCVSPNLALFAGCAAGMLPLGAGMICFTPLMQNSWNILNQDRERTKRCASQAQSVEPVRQTTGLHEQRAIISNCGLEL